MTGTIPRWVQRSRARAFSASLPTPPYLFCPEADCLASSREMLNVSAHQRLARFTLSYSGMTHHTDQETENGMGARPVITLIWTPLGWMADMSRAHGWEGIQSLFGTLMLPTPFTGSAAESMVLASVGALHPDHAVTVRVSSLYDSGREGSVGSITYADRAYGSRAEMRRADRDEMRAQNRSRR